ncbi:signal peptidase I [Klenkia brasiliensis]|uniref:Signal peptidase I n=1 Tax=Klenkia brasiliensis TaxID=333142 RepID=A0A1G7RBS9_9ACTN|nr:signal peptidase I [Klenkia brasiliensis]SDG08202.1 signal peptidase, endoplasmic reticulum-type [Klenkia brasiliensis]
MTLRRTAVTAVQLALVGAVVVAHLLGVRLVPVLTGSMTPYAPAGSLVLTVPVAGSDIRTGDVVAFRPPAPFEVTGGRPVLHRAADVADTPDGPAMTTRGDANPAADPWRVSLTGGSFGRTVLVVPLLGRVLAGGPVAALSLLAGAAALLAGAGSLRRTRREAATCPDCAAVAA